jgi:hypothetical protein
MGLLQRVKSWIFGPPLPVVERPEPAPLVELVDDADYSLPDDSGFFESSQIAAAKAAELGKQADEWTHASGNGRGAQVDRATKMIRKKCDAGDRRHGGDRRHSDRRARGADSEGELPAHA